MSVRSTYVTKRIIHTWMVQRERARACIYVVGGRGASDIEERVLGRGSRSSKRSVVVSNNQDCMVGDVALSWI